MRRRQCWYPAAVVSHAAAARQARVEVGDAVRAAHRSILVDLTAAVDVAAARQVPLGHGESRSAGGGEGRGREWCVHRSVLKHDPFCRKCHTDERNIGEESKVRRH